MSTDSNRWVLRAEVGLLKGSHFELSPGGLTIGRHSSNDVQVEDRSVSRYHCSVEFEGTSFFLVDQGSEHGTFLNGRKIEREELQQGDEVALCSALFRVVNKDAVDSASLELSIDEGFYHSPERFLERQAPSLATAVPPEAVLLRVSQAIGTLKSTETLVERLLELALEAAPHAERAALLFYDRTGDEQIRVQRRGEPRPSGGEPLSRTVVDRVLGERVALVIEDVVSVDGDLPQSLLAHEVATLVGVPLLDLQDRAMGLLYLDATSQGHANERGQLEFLTAFAGLASAALSNLMQLERLNQERQRLQEQQLATTMIGESKAMKSIYSMLERVAASDTTVLLLGESGTGKEVAAQTLHRSSNRSDRPFVAINCAALPENLLESELFGHEKGAFTSADQRKIGRIEDANTGTLFLDEISEMSPALQAKFLRVLEERSFERVGGSRTIAVDVRVIAATNRDLKEAIEEGTFREDLYYRLNVVPITLPPLRERGGDVMLLADHYRDLFASQLGRTVNGFSKEARQRLEHWNWPGNVRELRNAIERAVVLCESDRIEVHDLPEEFGQTKASQRQRGSYQDVLLETKRQLIRDAVLETKGHYADAARALDLHPNYLHRLIRNLELKEEIEAALKR